MSARGELFEKLTDGGWRLAPGEAESINGLLDAYRAEVLQEHVASFTMANARDIAREHRAAVLTGAADRLEAIDPIEFALGSVDPITELRRMAREHTPPET